jgi:hypothetical protein
MTMAARRAWVRFMAFSLSEGAGMSAAQWLVGGLVVMAVPFSFRAGPVVSAGFLASMER